MSIYDTFVAWIQTRAVSDQTLADSDAYDGALSASVPFYGHATLDYRKAANDGSAATTTANQYFWYVPFDITITHASYLTEDTLTADDANYATININRRANAGGGTVNVATVSTTTGGSGDWTANTAVDLPIAAGDVDADQLLAFQITKTGTGVIVPLGYAFCHYVLR